MVSEKKECLGGDYENGKFHAVDDCAALCNGVSSMFAFGTNDFGTSRCYVDGCRCLCETSATAEGTCTTVDHNGYRLYKYSIPTQGYYYLFPT